MHGDGEVQSPGLGVEQPAPGPRDMRLQVIVTCDHEDDDGLIEHGLESRDPRTLHGRRL